MVMVYDFTLLEYDSIKFNYHTIFIALQEHHH